MIFSLATIKGGASKSTTAVHLVHYLSTLNFSIALVDCDDQKSAANWVEKLPIDCHIFASADIEDIEDEIDKIEENYDAIIVDTAGSDEETMMMIIGRSHHVLMPICPSELDIDSSKKTIKRITRARKRYRRDIAATAFLAKVVANTTMRRDTIAVFKDYDDISFSPVEVPFTQRIIKLANTDKTVFTASNCKDLSESFTKLFAPLIGGEHNNG